MHKLCTKSDQLATLSYTHARAKELPFHVYLIALSTQWLPWLQTT